MVRQIVATLLFGLLPALSLAATEIRTVQAEATGVDREQAVFNALGDAVRQVRGAQISASRQVQAALSRMSLRTSDGHEASVEIQKGSSSNVSVLSEGLVSGYRVRSITDIPDGGKRAKLSVDVPVYKSPGNPDDGRWRVAVYPAWTARPAYKVVGKSLSGKEVSDRVTQAVTESLVQSRRFAVLARDKETDILSERARMAGNDISVEEKAMLGNELGAEYLISIQVTDLTMRVEENVSDLTGEHSRSQEGSMIVEVRVLVPATGAIVWSKTLNLSPEQLGVNLTRSDGAIQEIFDRTGQQVALSVIDVVWPPLVEAREGDELIINMGGSLMMPGQRWEAFALGNSVRNSHTGNRLGRSETYVGEVEIVRSTPKISYARTVAGDLGGGKLVLRRPQLTGQVDESKEAVRGTRKRTCLPIDPC